MVAGEIAYEEGQLKTVDEGAILREAAEIFQKKARDMAAADAAAVRLLPHYREMYNRAGAYELKMTAELVTKTFTWPHNRGSGKRLETSTAPVSIIA